jgi:transposase
VSGLSRRATRAARFFLIRQGINVIRIRLIGMSLADSAAAGLPPTDAEHLPNDVATLKHMVLELLASLHDRDRDNEALRHRINLLLRRLYGPRGERFDPDQPLLFAEMGTGQDTAQEVRTEPPAPTEPKRRCRPHGRRRLPESLPREPRHHELSEAERLCPHCGKVRIDIGTDRSEQLDYRPASLIVIEHFVHKYTCPCCNKRPSYSQEQSPPGPSSCQLLDSREVVIAAPKPVMPIAKGLPGPGLLAHLIVSKCVDHLPLHRLERVYQRQGLFLHRSTLCDWMEACARLLRPLYDLMVSVVMQSRSLHTDDTRVKMQELVTHLLSTARMWVYLGDAAHPFNVFDFTLNRKRDGPQKFLANYQGYLHADAFSGYDALYLPDPRTAAARIIEVACNAHARRKFYEARGSDTLRSHQALAFYRQLYELERQAKDFSDVQRLQIRQELSLPILEQFHQWLLAQRPEVLPKSPMREAISYALNNWGALVRYTEAGFLAIDNNVAEREMKRMAIGRKNWLTVGSPRGSQTAAVLFSFTSTCQRLGVEPWAYLQDALTCLPTMPAGQYGDLLPDHWQEARRAKTTTPATTAAESTTPSAESAF